MSDDTEKVDQLKNNELWAFIPPEVLPHIPSEYPYTHQLLLDGVSVVKDVVARKTSGSYPYSFERTVADAIAGRERDHHLGARSWFKASAAPTRAISRSTSPIRIRP